MSHKGRTYFILTLVLLLFLIPTASILSQIDAFKGTMQGWIILAILFGISLIYYLIMTYIIFYRGKRK